MTTSVIQVHQGPKWFIWPTKKERRLSENAAKKESIDKANNNDTVNNNSNPKTTTNNRKPLNTQNQSNNQQIDLTAVDGQLTPVTASSQPMNTPTSEPTTRRLSTKSHKAQTEPISASAPSSTFKILSICKKWEESLEMSDDELDDLENCLIVSSCRQMSRSLDHVSQSTLSSSPPNSENQVR
ncbi:unnamed protein product [Toxocara canis]|uniref:Uncharacterized protein n=1 Tax=Toxocara canis TaxID=6265 RepID=A0A183V2N1_TOXCA|nr:unnamed protein product [Toxocara canis]